MTSKLESDEILLRDVLWIFGNIFADREEHLTNQVIKRSGLVDLLDSLLNNPKPELDSDLIWLITQMHTHDVGHCNAGLLETSARSMGTIITRILDSSKKPELIEEACIHCLKFVKKSLEEK